MSCSAGQGHVFVRVSNNPFGQTYARTPLMQRGGAPRKVAHRVCSRHVRQHRSGRTGRDRITVVPMDFITGRERSPAKVAVPRVGFLVVGKPICDGAAVVGETKKSRASTCLLRLL